jgi:ATP-dependent protease HslVU (ClpYQ) ATPase subunit
MNNRKIRFIILAVIISALILTGGSLFLGSDENIKAEKYAGTAQAVHMPDSDINMQKLEMEFARAMQDRMDRMGPALMEGSNVNMDELISKWHQQREKALRFSNLKRGPDNRVIIHRIEPVSQ